MATVLSHVFLFFKLSNSKFFSNFSSGFWKSCLNNYYLLDNYEGVLFLLQCNYDVNQINISPTFYQDLLVWWSDIGEIVDPNNVYRYIIWNNKEIKINGESVFYKHSVPLKLPINIPNFNVILDFESVKMS